MLQKDSSSSYTVCFIDSEGHLIHFFAQCAFQILLEILLLFSVRLDSRTGEPKEMMSPITAHSFRPLKCPADPEEAESYSARRKAARTYRVLSFPSIWSSCLYETKNKVSKAIYLLGKSDVSEKPYALRSDLSVNSEQSYAENNSIEKIGNGLLRFKC